MYEKENSAHPDKIADRIAGAIIDLAYAKEKDARMDNIFIRTDPAGNIKADKEKSTEKIDGAIATIMALERAVRCGNVNTESEYYSREILFI